MSESVVSEKETSQRTIIYCCEVCSLCYYLKCWWTIVIYVCTFRYSLRQIWFPDIMCCFSCYLSARSLYVSHATSVNLSVSHATIPLFLSSHLPIRSRHSSFSHSLFSPTLPPSQLSVYYLYIVSHFPPKYMQLTRKIYDVIKWTFPSEFNENSKIEHETHKLPYSFSM